MVYNLKFERYIHFIPLTQLKNALKILQCNRSCEMFDLFIYNGDN